MKKITILLCIAAFVLSLTSCGGGAVSDFQKSIDLMKKFTDVATKAAEDKVIDDSEAEKISNILKEFSAFEDMETKFDEAQLKEIEEYQEKNKEELEKIGEAYANAIMAVMMCEGADKINIE
jgi:predicted glycosyl hydrolase (DUF1957 family)